MLNQIEEKVKKAIATIAGLKTRIRELEAENHQLRTAMQDNQTKLTHMLDELARVDEEDGFLPPLHQDEPPLSEPPAWEADEQAPETALVSEILLETPGNADSPSLGQD